MSIHRTDLHTLLGIIDRLVWPAHGLPTSCFSPILNCSVFACIGWDSVIGLVIESDSS